MKNWILSSILVLGILQVHAQDLGEGALSPALSSSFTGGFHMSTRGVGFDLLFSRGNGPSQLLFGLRGFNIRDGREAKIESNFREQGSKFVYGKLNHAFVLTPTFGLQREVISRNANNLLSLTLLAQAGPALGLIRPYYLDIFVPSPISPLVGTSVSQPYDPENHTYNDIVGATSFFSAKWDLSLQPGISARIGGRVDFARRPQSISGLEIGINADYFFKAVPIMAEQNGVSNQQLYLAGTLGIVFGSRW